jgi:hypothetical protein
MESQFERIQGRRFRSPDGAERYLVDEALLNALAERLGGELAEPLKHRGPKSALHDHLGDAKEASLRTEVQTYR